ncbi:hypothetical protein [Larkinella punicea]|uniref:hypothetical protein n=1 Tax=Larkinella punicea TaxID=2315727 RepID=UPI001058E585|nr:hypothetical protein [Larkinella punicea]
MKMKRVPRSLVYISFVIFSALPWSCLEDHRPQTDNELRLINCRSGWRPVGVFSQGSRIGDAAAGCYRMIFLKDGKLIFNREQCTGQDTTAVVSGWSVTSTNLSLPYRPGNLYGPPNGGLLEELTLTSLKFSYRGDPNKITEIWACP